MKEWRCQFTFQLLYAQNLYRSHIFKDHEIPFKPQDDSCEFHLVTTPNSPSGKSLTSRAGICEDPWPSIFSCYARMGANAFMHALVLFSSIVFFLPRITGMFFEWEWGLISGTHGDLGFNAVRQSFSVIERYRIFLSFGRTYSQYRRHSSASFPQARISLLFFKKKEIFQRLNPNRNPWIRNNFPSSMTYPPKALLSPSIITTQPKISRQREKVLRFDLIHHRICDRGSRLGGCGWLKGC